ncbi:malto-oligosyltrehalose synthase [Streptomyces palmae]|uniref:Malto-oligosyltrehalose synthase n=1 Tax=Streptomyces palmae TaxID=1701085 RepID=A0A4Z0H8K8_9ACTN|nr:malto-oligosyltrehalose synthase [Streptomyces palmae]TGB12918.1 malto-oligosyltrehalose synthase [Streptomyces palmae]
MTPESTEPPGSVRPDAPTATYRLQLQPGFPFAAARDAVPYLASLGVSHLHLSPVLEAVPGSTHGYDVVDHCSVRGELGGEEALRELADTAHAHGLGLIADIVPNHMAVPVPERLNHPLWEVLRDGPGSRYARWFDIDWTQHQGKVLLPVLGGPLGEELKALRLEGGVLRYHDHAFPLRPGTEELPLPEVLEPQWYRLGWWRLARTELNYRRFFTISTLIAVRVEHPEVFAASHGKLLELMAAGVIDGLRVDHPDGLADPAGYLRRLARSTGGRWTVVEKILARCERLPDGWPVAGTTGYDALHHIDGLFLDPTGLEELTHVYRAMTAPPTDRGGDWPATVRRAACQVLDHELAAELDRLVRCASRICADTPRLRDHAPWALRTALRELLVRLPVYRPYAAPGTPLRSADSTMLEAAARQARTAFTVPEEAGAVDTVCAAALGRLGDGPPYREFCARFAQTAAALRAKAVEDTAFYRYTPLLSAAEVGGDPGDPTVAPEEFHAFCTRLLRDWPLTGTVLSTHDTKRSADVRARLAALTECPRRWRQFLTEALESAPIAGPPGDATHTPPQPDAPQPDPPQKAEPHLDTPPRDQAQAHAPQTAARRTDAPRTDVPRTSAPPSGASPGHTRHTSTQLGEPPADAPQKAEPRPGTPPADQSRAPQTTAPGADAPRAPDPQLVWVAWQTALGLGAADATPVRLTPALLKAVREAGLRTTWTEPDAEYEDAVATFAQACLCGPNGVTGPGFAALEQELSAPARANTLGATLLHLTMPGVPDLYTGTESVYRALVDPDNRQPPCFRSQLLADLDAGQHPDGLDAEKLRVTATALRLRRHHPEWFGAQGSYTPLAAVGSAAAHCVAFARAGAVITAVTRLSRRLAERGGWAGTSLPLPPGTWRDLLSGTALRGRAPLADLFAELPVALLVRDRPS